jgi:hypothetical protein
MYARRQTRPKPRRSQVKSFPAPINGWISNRSLAIPQEVGQAAGAAILDNFIPRATSVQLRRGKVLYCTLGNGTEDAVSLFSYNNGTNKRLFAATPTTIYDITTILFPYEVEIVDEDEMLLGDEFGNWFGWNSTEFSDVMSGLSGGNWIVVQFATTGGVYLIGVNGEDPGFIFDGTNFYPNMPGGVYSITYEAETSEFTEGDVLTGGTSGATATIYRAIPNEFDDTGTLWLYDVTGGPFDDGELITDADGGSATASSASEIAAPGVTFDNGLTSADMSYVWVYKNRLWFAQKDTMNAWYLDTVDSVGGDATIFPLSGVFGRGGSLLFGQVWSLEGSLEGGMSEQNIFVSTEGEVAVYQGIYPGEAETWARVGLYRIGKPLGNRAFIRGGGDLAVATSIGLVPLSKAIELDLTALNVAAVSYNIADAWSDAVQQRGLSGWQAEIWPELKIAAFAPPTPDSFPIPVMFIVNSETGAWARFTGWQAFCFEVFEGLLYFGAPDGKVFIANASGQDDGAPYTGAVMPLFDDLGSPASAKIGRLARGIVRATTTINDLVQWHADFRYDLPAAPSSTVIGGAPSVWDAGVWGSSVWGSSSPQVISENWRSVSGLGYACSVSLQVTSGAVAPLDAELIRIDATYETAEIVT